jgi:PTH1 family peptidyl-tRNA hydrolase
MILIVGLGNPGRKFQKTRHNLGWIILDLLQRKWEKEYSFSDWKEVKRFKAEISQGKIKNKRIILAKPLTFMNLSGQTVKALISYYKIRSVNLIVVHDDSDLSLGVNRIAKNRGSAGHKGVESIISYLKTKSFLRFRIGFRPKDKKIKSLDRYVLNRFTQKEKSIIITSIDKAVIAIADTASGVKLEKIMNEFNRKTR